MQKKREKRRRKTSARNQNEELQRLHLASEMKILLCKQHYPHNKSYRIRKENNVLCKLCYSAFVLYVKQCFIMWVETAFALKKFCDFVFNFYE